MHRSTQIKIISAVHRTGPDHRPVEQVAIEVSKHIKVSCIEFSSSFTEQIFTHFLQSFL